MKKAACTVLILIMAILLINPSAGDARGGRWGGHSGGYRGWWAPWAVIGGAAVLAPYYYRGYYAPYYPPYYYEPYYYAPPPVVIQPQVPVPSQTAPPVSTSSERIFVYPRQGQTDKQQATDRYECHRWAVGQTTYDPTQPPGSIPESQLNQKRGDYYRAMGACLDGRGYTMK